MGRGDRRFGPEPDLAAPDATSIRPRRFSRPTAACSATSHSDTISTSSATAIPHALKQATVAIEDRRFYQHGALDYQGILRAGVKDLVSGAQLAPGRLDADHAAGRQHVPAAKIAARHNLKYKIIQAKLAEQLEPQPRKSWILDNYLNDVPYGTVGGADRRSGSAPPRQMFFDKPVWTLNLSQMALIAGLPQAPSRVQPVPAPVAGPQAPRRRVAGDAAGALHQRQASPPWPTASRSASTRNTRFTSKRQPYVFDYVEQQLLKRFGAKTVENGGLKVYTTIDPKRQHEAEQAIFAHEGGAGQPAAAFGLPIDPQQRPHPRAGDLLQVRDRAGETKFDYAWQGRRQTGSAFKVFSLMTLIHDYNGDPEPDVLHLEVAPGGGSSLPGLLGAHRPSTPTRAR